MQQANGTSVKKRSQKKKSSSKGGYIGRSMSVNAKKAYERGLKPLSRIRSADLKQNGFHYPVAFFRWLVHNWDIKPREMHHTSAACRLTPFYDGSVIRYAAHCCSLELLFQIYKGKMTIEQARQNKGICYARAQILDTLLGGKSGNTLCVNCLLYNQLLLLSPKLCVQADDPRVNVLEIFEELPEQIKSEKWNSWQGSWSSIKPGCIRNI